MKNAREKFIRSINAIYKNRDRELSKSVRRAGMSHILCSETEDTYEAFDSGFTVFECFVRSFPNIESELLVEEDSFYDRYKFLDSEVVLISDCGVTLMVASKETLIGLYDSFILALNLREKSKHDTFLNN